LADFDFAILKVKWFLKEKSFSKGDVQMMIIRIADENDIPDLSYLMGELGYPTSEKSMRSRFIKITSAAGNQTFVAEKSGRVIGMAGISTGYLYERDGIYARITAFVVDSAFRNCGIGKKLIKEVEEWARSIGAAGIVLNSGKRPEREAAHQFYRKMGFEERSIGFVKSLTS
jgi:GNAT superfamily N-acetyltransferase